MSALKQRPSHSHCTKPPATPPLLELKKPETWTVAREDGSRSLDVPVSIDRAEDGAPAKITSSFALQSTADDTQLLDAVLGKALGADGLGWEKGPANDLAIAASEAFNDAARHGNKEDPGKSVRIKLDCTRDKAAVTIRDQGDKPFVPDESIPNPTLDENLLKESGRGIFIIRELTDHAAWSAHADGNQVRMVKYRKPQQ